MAEDPEYLLRQTFAEQLSGIVELCKDAGTDESYRAILDDILPRLAKLLADSQPEVRIAAGESLVAIAPSIRNEDLGHSVLTIVIQLAHDDEKEDLRMTAAVLLNELAPTLGPELCEQFVLTEICYLAEDPEFRVRKAAALNMDAICRTVGPHRAVERLLPAFLELTNDDIWGVRRACAECLGSLSKTLSPEERVKRLLPVMKDFLEDKSRWVRLAAYQHLGPFLATLSSRAISSQVLRLFSSMCPTPAENPDRRGSAESPDAETTIYCAFSFPAVVLTLGRERWPELRPLFFLLARHHQRKVRRPIAHALHELARILGSEIAEKDLCPMFDLYQRDVDEVRVGIIKNVAAFLGALSPGCREAYLPVLDDMVRSSKPSKWRIRILLAKQLPELALLFSPAATYSVVIPFADVLLDDPVDAVRTAAAKALAPLLLRMGECDSMFRETLEERLLRRANSPNYQFRLILARILDSLAQELPVDEFRNVFLDALIRLGRDAVRNVRLAVARILSASRRDRVSSSATSESADGTPGRAGASGGASMPSAASAEHNQAVPGAGGGDETPTRASDPAPASGGDGLTETLLHPRLRNSTRAWLLEEEPIQQLIMDLQNDSDREIVHTVRETEARWQREPAPDAGAAGATGDDPASEPAPGGDGSTEKPQNGGADGASSSVPGSG